VQALVHALTQAFILKLTGNAKRFPWRISGIVFSEVMIITKSGKRKKAAEMSKNA
jgi:hypothetical protein